MAVLLKTSSQLFVFSVVGSRRRSLVSLVVVRTGIV